MQRHADAAPTSDDRFATNAQAMSRVPEAAERRCWREAAYGKRFRLPLGAPEPAARRESWEPTSSSVERPLKKPPEVGGQVSPAGENTPARCTAAGGSLQRCPRPMRHRFLRRRRRRRHGRHARRPSHNRRNSPEPKSRSRRGIGRLCPARAASRVLHERSSYARRHLKRWTFLSVRIQRPALRRKQKAVTIRAHRLSGGRNTQVATPDLREVDSSRRLGKELIGRHQIGPDLLVG